MHSTRRGSGDAAEVPRDRTASPCRHERSEGQANCDASQHQLTGGIDADVPRYMRWSVTSVALHSSAGGLAMISLPCPGRRTNPSGVPHNSTRRVSFSPCMAAGFRLGVDGRRAEQSMIGASKRRQRTCGLARAGRVSLGPSGTGCASHEGRVGRWSIQLEHVSAVGRHQPS